MISVKAPDDCSIAKQPLLRDFVPDTWRSLSSKAANVRLVRCPKCRGVLPELADVPVYKCGGCNAVLKAKNYKEGRESRSSEVIDDKPSLKNESEHDFKIKDLDTSSKKGNLSSGETPKQVESEDSHRKQIESETKEVSHEISSSGEITCQEKEELSTEAGGDKHAENYNGGYSNCGSESPDTQVVSGGSSPSDNAAQTPNVDMLSMENNSVSDSKSEESEKIVSHGPKCMASKETMQTAKTNNISITSDEDMDDAKLSGRCGDVSKSSTPRDNHSIDSSVVSYDGLGEQISEQHLHISKRPSSGESQSVAEIISNKGQQTREDVRVNNKMNVNVEEENQARKLSLKSVNEKDDAGFVGEALQEPIRYDPEAQQKLNRNGSKGFHQVPKFKGLEKDKSCYEEHLYRRRRSADYDHVGPSNCRHKEFQCSSGLYPAENLKFDECNQLELLRKLDELRDQLNRSCAHQRKGKENIVPIYTQQERQRPLYSTQKLSNQENLAHCTSCYPQQRPEAFKLRKSMTYRGSCSQMSHSGLASNCMYHADCSHSHGYHEDWKCLQKLEPPNFCHERGLHRTCTRNICYNPYSPSTSSPRRLVHSNCPCRGCDEAQPSPHVLRNFDNDMAKLHLKERRQALKQHYRPMAGGAPFITCYNCSVLLKIPADFLHSSKRCHRLRCGSCSKVLLFSLHRRIHIVPHSPKSVVAVPSAEVDNSTHVDTSPRNSSNANDCTQGDSISYSEEDYGLSTFQSSSTEGEPAILSPAFPSPQINRVDQMQPSSSHAKPTNEKAKKTVISFLGNKYKYPMQVQKFVGSSSEAKLSLIAEKGLGTGSPLHRLMGYSSPGEIIYGAGAVIHS